MSLIRPSRDVAPLVALIGDAATLALLEAHAGIRIQVPHRPVNEASSLAQAIGLEAAQILQREFAGTKLYVPLAKRWRIQHYRARGLSYAEIARKVGCNEVTVFTALADSGMTTQMALPL